MDADSIRAEIAAADLAPGGEVRLLRVGLDRLRLVGLDAALIEELRQRYGPFLEADRPDPAAYRLEFVAGSRPHWLPPAAPGERYRVELAGPPGSGVVVSYHFALVRPGPDATQPVWRAALAAAPAEPRARIVENVARCLAARAALDRGGFAMHGAGVVRDGRAHVFAGPSNSGKTTAVRMSAPAVSLGDDFAVVVPEGDGWVVPAVPFDNAERIAGEPPEQPVPLEGIWRLDKAPRHELERPAHLAAVASLMGCVAFPWLFPGDAADVLSRVTRVVEQDRFGVLHFRPDPGFWSVLVD